MGVVNELAVLLPPRQAGDVATVADPPVAPAPWLRVLLLPEAVPSLSSLPHPGPQGYGIVRAEEAGISPAAAPTQC